MTSLNVLLVEDNPGDARLVRELLRGQAVDLEHVERLADARTAVESHRTDVALVDLTLPDAGREDTIAWMVGIAQHVPIVVLTGCRDDELAGRLMGTGIQEYVEKDGLETESLLNAVHHAAKRGRYYQELEALRERQLRARDELLGHVSHELRTPLNAVYQFVTLLRDGVVGGLGSEQVECIEIVLRNIEQLRRMIADLLETTRIEAGSVRVESSPVTLAPILLELARATEPVAAARDLELATSVPEDLPTAVADATRVRQVVSNLLDNAIKFTNAGGRVELSAALHGGRWIAIAVRDTGCGIPAAQQARVFERLYQVDNGGEATRKGLGLGLHLCRELVNRMGGQIWVESELGAGSYFAFTLPLASPPAEVS